MSVTNTWADGNILYAGSLNQNFTDVDGPRLTIQTGSQYGAGWVGIANGALTNTGSFIKLTLGSCLISYATMTITGSVWNSSAVIYGIGYINGTAIGSAILSNATPETAVKTVNLTWIPTDWLAITTGSIIFNAAINIPAGGTGYASGGTMSATCRKFDKLNYNL